MRIKCGACRKRTLESVGDHWDASVVPPLGSSSRVAGWYSQRDGAGAEASARWVYKCHPKECRAVIPVNAETLTEAVELARSKGKRVVYVPNDLNGGKVKRPAMMFAELEVSETV